MIARIQTWFARRRVYNQTIRELSSLRYHELRDLGLEPEMIPSIARQAAHGVQK